MEILRGTYHIDIPGRELTSIDLIPEQFNAVVGVLSGKLASLFVIKSLESTTDAPVDLSVDELALFVDKLECMARVTVHVTETVGSSAIREQNHHLVNGLGVQRQVVLKKRVSIMGDEDTSKLILPRKHQHPSDGSPGHASECE